MTKRKPGRPRTSEEDRFGLVLAVRLKGSMARQIRTMAATEIRPLSYVIRRLIQVGLESQEGSGGKAEGRMPRMPRKQPGKG